jgi:hypothetical protein
MTADDVMQAFSTAGQDLPREAMQWSLDHWEEVAPRFVAELETLPLEDDPPKDKAAALFFILHLFAQKRETRAWHGLCRLMHHPQAIDAVLGDGIYDRAGNKLIPPRYYDAAAYRDTIRRIRALEPELLLTAHYAPMGREAARTFCDRSLAHVDAVEAIVREEHAAGAVTLCELTQRVDERLGPFPEFATEIAAGVRSHLAAVG